MHKTVKNLYTLIIRDCKIGKIRKIGKDKYKILNYGIYVDVEKTIEGFNIYMKKGRS